MASGGTSQDTERIGSSEGHSLPEDSIGRDKSGHGKNLTERGHSPTGDGIGRDKSGTERIRPSEGNSLSGDGIGRDKSGYRNNTTE